MRISRVDPNLEDSDSDDEASVNMQDVDPNIDSSDDETDLERKPYIEMSRYKIPAPLYNSEKIISKVKLVPDRELNDLDSAMSYMTEFADTLITDLCGNLRENDLMRIELECESLHKPISTALLPKKHFSTSYFLSLIGRVLQSDESIFMGQEITVACEKFLNAAYGKLGQAGGKINHQIFTDALSFWKFCNSSDHTISGLMFFRDKVQVSYTIHSDIDALSSNTNVVYAAMITANARLKLLRVLDNLGDRCLYFDTDSIIYTSRPGEWNPATGRFLGDFTNELNEGEHITTFTSAGPKNYSFRTNKNREIIKVRGFTIRDGTASARLNMSLMEAMILRAEPQQRMIARVLKQKKRTKNNDVASDRWVEQIEMGETLIRDSSLGIVTAPFTRKYEVCYVKRKIVNGFHTLPWGFRQ